MSEGSTDDWAFYAEIALVYGGALALGFQQLWSLRRDKRRREAEDEQKAELERSKKVY